MLARGGTLVSYGTASTKDVPGNPQVPVLKLLAKLYRVEPAAERAQGARSSTCGPAAACRKDRFRAQLREDLGHVMDLLAQGAITPQIAARFPLAQAAEALRFAEAGGNTGKVLIVP